MSSPATLPKHLRKNLAVSPSGAHKLSQLEGKEHANRDRKQKMLQRASEIETEQNKLRLKNLKRAPLQIEDQK
jgi:hypothetical protein